MQTRPDLLGEGSESASGGRGWIVVGGFIALLVVLISPFASADPDGLERVAEDLGFLETGQSAPFSIIPDYTIPFLGETSFSTVLAGLVGIVVVAAIVVLIGRGMKAKS